MSRFTAEDACHEVGVDELFFSVTDAEGIIRQANDVFVRLSRHGRDELIDAPHHIVRHPAVPAGVFHEMWANLRAGRPFAGYLRNRAGDDSTYDLLATVTPLPDGGFLAVSTRPVTGHLDTVRDIYYAVNDLEHRVLSEGTDRRDAAEQGAARLREELAGRGFGTYRQLQWEILPDEVAERERRSGGLPGREGATGPLAELLSAVRDLFAALDSFMDAQRDIAGTTASLARAGERLDEETAAAVRVSGEMGRLDIAGPERTLLLAPLQVWNTMHGAVGEHTADLAEMLRELEANGARTRFHIALARLHTTMTADFAAGLDNHPSGDDSSAAAIPSLTDALRAGVAEMNDRVAEHQRLSRRVSSKVRSVVSLMEVPRTMIADWLVDSDVEQLADNAQQLVAEVNRAVEGASASIIELERLGERLVSETTPQLEALRADVDRISAATTAYLGQE
ncbi:PAS domain-containing protein [Corynebacterium halotolerans]|nr:PAS domain-containing protein [Corynebacterium halotolerans]